jgi:hypothetical protein
LADSAVPEDGLDLMNCAVDFGSLAENLSGTGILNYVCLTILSFRATWGAARKY